MTLGHVRRNPASRNCSDATTILQRDAACAARRRCRKDEEGPRRILGWPLQWPSDSTIGHFELVKSSWLPTAAAKGQGAEGNEHGTAVSTGINGILVPVGEVVFVEFLES